LEGIGHGIIEILSIDFPGRAEEKQLKSSVGMAGFPVKILPEHPLNTRICEEIYLMEYNAA
jgi:hypothetical protein